MRPRLSVFRSNKKIYCQLIDDKIGKTLVAASESDFSPKLKKVVKKMTKTQKAQLVGQILAKKAKVKGVKRIFFDRGSYKYHGRVKALAEQLRKGGLEF